jgi:ATP-binding cassette subfamily F protein uup
LRGLSAGIVLISHDRRLLEKLSRSIVWLDRGQTRRLDRGFAHFEAWRDEVLEQEERDFHKLGRQIAREEDWLRYGVTARRKRNVKRVADLARPMPACPASWSRLPKTYQRHMVAGRL